MTNAVAVIGLDEVEKMAKYVIESGLFGVKTIPQAVALMLLCQAKGMHPMEAVEEFHIIQGRHVMKSERMLAKFQAAGGKVAWKELTDQRAEATFTHPLGGSVTIDWDIERAKRAGIAGKDNWKNYPRAMLRSRVVGEGIAATLPGVKAGAMTPEEAADVDPEAPKVEHDVTPPKTGVAALAEKLAAQGAVFDHATAAGEKLAIIEKIAAGLQSRPIREVIAEEIDAGKPVADDFTLTPPSVDEQILTQLRATALEGQEALKTTWEGLTKEHRKAFADQLPSLKEAAAKAEADQASLRG